MSQDVFVMGMAGASAAGKTTLARKIKDTFGDAVGIIPEDSYYKDSNLPFEERSKVNYDHPDSLDHTYMMDQLRILKGYGKVDVPVYDYANHARSKKTISVGPHKVIVLEGILLFVHEEVRNMIDLLVYVDTPLDLCLARRVWRDINERGRNVKYVLDQYLTCVKPMFHQFIEPSRQYASVIVPNHGYEGDLHKAAELLCGRIASIV